MFVYTIISLEALFAKSQFVLNANKRVRDLTTDFTVHKPAQEGFAIAVGFKYLGEENILSETIKQYFNFEILQFEGYNENGEFVRKYTPLELQT